MATPITILKKRAEFLRLNNDSHKVVITACILLMKPREEALATAPRVGFTVTSQIGNAVKRNRIKRRLRAAFQALLPAHGQKGADYVVIARSPAFDMDYEKLVADLKAALIKIPSTPTQSKRPAKK